MKPQLFIVFILIGFYSIGQEIEKDRIQELENKVKEAITDSSKIMSQVALAEYMVYRKFSEAETHANLALEIAKSSEKAIEKGLLGPCYNVLGIIKRKQGDYVGASHNLLKAKEVFMNIGDSINMANVMHNLGMVYTGVK